MVLWLTTSTNELLQDYHRDDHYGDPYCAGSDFYWPIDSGIFTAYLWKPGNNLIGSLCSEPSVVLSSSVDTRIVLYQLENCMLHLHE